jgi:seryl-tRNA synthetase
MIDPKLLREQPELVKKACRNKRSDVDVDRVVLLDADRRRIQGDIDGVNAARKEAAQAKDVEKGRTLKERAGALEAELARVEEELTPLLLRIPNLPSVDTPVGADDAENVVLRSWGEPPAFDFAPKDHMALAEGLGGLIDSETAAKVAGARFTYLKGDLVLLQNAIAQYAMAVLTSEETLRGIIAAAGLTVPSTPFVPVAPPLMIRPEAFQRMARLEPRDERYYIPSDDLFLIGSAEHTLGPLHMDETLDEARLPLRYAAFTPAFRREAGSYGKDTKGILRLHQFDKVEMESFSAPDGGLAEQDFFVAIQEYLMRSIGIPYRVVMTCTGDQGDPDARHLDIEAWMPGQGTYRETHSADYMTDYQARRLGTKVRRAAAGKPEFVHMNDATAFAVGRTLIAIIENGQRADGSVAVPEALVPYVGKNVMHSKTSRAS